MSAVELCRDALSKRFPDRSVCVTVDAWQQAYAGSRYLRFSISILPAFGKECWQHQGDTLAECLRALDIAEKEFQS